MPTTSVGYINGRISVRRRAQLTRPQLDRLLNAGGFEEAKRVLAELGWASGDVSQLDYEQVASAHLQEVCAFVRDNTPLPEATDCFLLHYDIENLKMLIKARTLGTEPQLLSACGIYPVEALRHAVAEGVYRDLPPVLSEALDALEKRLAVRPEAMDVDVTLDQAMYALIFQKLKDVHSAAIRRYFAARVDLSNALALLRSLKMGRDLAEYERLYLPGGTVPLECLAQAYGAPETLHRLYEGYGREIALAVKQAQEKDALPALEKAADDYLLSLFTPYKFQPGRLEAVIGYLLAKQREVAAVRLALSAQYNGFSPEAVAERLRELHG